MHLELDIYLKKRREMVRYPTSWEEGHNVSEPARAGKRHFKLFNSVSLQNSNAGGGFNFGLLCEYAEFGITFFVAIHSAVFLLQ